MAEKPAYEELEQRVRDLESAESKCRAKLALLQQKETRYRNLFENMLHEVHVWELVFDGRGNIETWKLVDANPAALKSWGKTLPEIIGKTTDEIFPGFNTSEFFKPIVEKIFRDGLPHMWERYFPGTNQILHMISVPFDKYFISTGLDFTERKRTEKELHRNHEMLKRTEAIAHVGSWQWDIQQDRVLWSEEMFRIFGREPSEVAPSFAEHPELYVAEDMRRLGEAVERCVNHGTPYELELQAIRTDGEIRNCIARGQPQTDESGNVVRLIGSLQDITERKKSEKKLISLERRNQALLDHSPVCHKIVDLDFNLQYMSANGFRMLKLDSDAEVYGKPYPFYFFPEAFKDEMLENLRKVKQTGKTITMEALTNDIEGNEVWLDSSLIPVFDEEEIAYITVVSANTTRRKRDEKERVRLEDQLRQIQKMESIGNLAGGIAHDFNNILFPIVGMAELLLDDLPKGTREYENAEDIFKAGIRGSDLVKQILAFSRQSEHKIIPVRVQQILKEVLSLGRATIPTNIEIIRDIQPDCGKVMADATQIHQVIMNVVTNAYHAVENQGGTITVQLKQVSISHKDSRDIPLVAGEYALLSISDTGRGMSPDIMEKVFEPYFTTKEKGKGTGLGLAVAYGIIKEHKGEIKVASKEGRGTTFDIYLPLIDEPVETETMPEIGTNPTGTERILLVDDEESIARLEKQMLERLGYDVVSRSSSIDALEVFKSDPRSFDLVISDMSMPNMTGDQLANELISIRPDIPVIICTGFSERINKEKAKLYGIRGFLMKPIVRSELAEMVRKVLDET